MKVNLATPSGTVSVTIEELISRFELCNLAEGKSPRTIRWYSDILFSFLRYLKRDRQSDDITSFNIDKIRGYISYMRHKNKFNEHSYTPT